MSEKVPAKSTEEDQDQSTSSSIIDTADFIDSNGAFDLKAAAEACGLEFVDPKETFARKAQEQQGEIQTEAPPEAPPETAPASTPDAPRRDVLKDNRTKDPHPKAFNRGSTSISVQLKTSLEEAGDATAAAVAAAITASATVTGNSKEYMLEKLVESVNKRLNTNVKTESDSTKAPVRSLVTPTKSPKDIESQQHTRTHMLQSQKGALLRGSSEDGSVNSGLSKRTSSMHLGLFEVEQMADRIEKRNLNRVPIVPAVRSRFLRQCRKINDEKRYKSRKKIRLSDLQEIYDKFLEEPVPYNPIKHAAVYIGFRDEHKQFKDVLERALIETAQVDDDWFYYLEYTLYHTKKESFWPWMRSGTIIAFFTIFCWYFFTPVLFCSILQDKNVCPDDPEEDRSYYGWITALYFSSATISTVGYGDISVTRDTRAQVLVGILYMICSLLVAISVFSTAVDEAFSPFAKLTQRLYGKFTGLEDDGEAEDFYRKIKRIRYTRLIEIAIQVCMLNLLGVFVSRYFANRADEPEHDWTWMDSLYWSVQTTTTIGYGDISMPFGMRAFQVVYLAISTYAVGNALGKLGNLKAEIRDLRAMEAWKQREVTKSMIEDMQAYIHDDEIDEYEWVVSTLLTLGKLSTSELKPIMEKFKKLAGAKGYISVDDGL